LAKEQNAALAAGEFVQGRRHELTMAEPRDGQGFRGEIVDQRRTLASSVDHQW